MAPERVQAPERVGPVQLPALELGAPVPLVPVAPGLKDSIGDRPNHSNLSVIRVTVKFLSKFM